MKALLDRLAVPIIQGGMGMGISLGGLAGAVAKEGGMGVISTANIGFRQPDFWSNPKAASERALIEEIHKARDISEGRGLLAINTMVATSEFSHMIKTAVREGIDGIICGAGMPLNLPEAAGENVMISPIVSSFRAAKLICKHWLNRYRRKPDFIVVEGPRAGGHLGFSRESLLLKKAQPVEEVVAEIAENMPEIPVFGAGGIFTAEDVARLQGVGAAGAQIATRFIATHECDATQGYKDRILAAKAEDVVIIQSPVGMPGRALRSPLIERMERGARSVPTSCINCITYCNPRETIYCINRALAAAFYGNWEEGLFFCGDNVGRVQKQVSVHELIKELTNQ